MVLSIEWHLAVERRVAFIHTCMDRHIPRHHFTPDWCNIPCTSLDVGWCNSMFVFN
jgi:hypothetical protein